tara:strand:+ start:12427 stop:13029 length:603 start_codon:yes stop_codon:yes gene_type:complete
MNKNYNQYIDDLLSNIDLPTDAELVQETKAKKVSISRKSQKATDETRRILSNAHKGKKLSEEHIEKIKTKGKQTKWEQLLEKYPLQFILDAQLNNGNHQNNTCKELGISFLAYKKLCKHYEIELKKCNYEKTEFARTKQSEPILVWKCSKAKPFRPIGKPKVYYSVSECCRSFEPKLHKGNMLRNMNNGTPYRDMFFKKK